MRNFKWIVFCVALASAICSSPSANAMVFDDFSDLNDTVNPTWTHLNGLVNSTGQTWDASTGQYRLQAPNNGFVLQGSALGFAGSHVGPTFSDVQATADFVDFPGGLAFGVAARLSGKTGPASINNFNSLTGYAYAYEPLAAGGLGEMVLYRIFGASLQDIGSQQVTLDPNKDYRFRLTATGTQLHGQVFEIGGGMVGEKFATDPNYASGVSGVFSYSGSGAARPPVDFTIDNFRVQVPEPATGLLMLVASGALVLCRRFHRGK